MGETKKPTEDKAKTTTEEELSEEQLEQVTGGAINGYLSEDHTASGGIQTTVVANEKAPAAYEWITPTAVTTAVKPQS